MAMANVFYDMVFQTRTRQMLPLVAERISFWFPWPLKAIEEKNTKLMRDIS